MIVVFLIISLVIGFYALHCVDKYSNEHHDI